MCVCVFFFSILFTSTQQLRTIFLLNSNFISYFFLHCNCTLLKWFFLWKMYFKPYWRLYNCNASNFYFVIHTITPNFMVNLQNRLNKIKKQIAQRQSRISFQRLTILFFFFFSCFINWWKKSLSNLILFFLSFQTQNYF